MLSALFKELVFVDSLKNECKNSWMRFAIAMISFSLLMKSMKLLELALRATVIWMPEIFSNLLLLEVNFNWSELLLSMNIVSLKKMQL